MTLSEAIFFIKNELDQQQPRNYGILLGIARQLPKNIAYSVARKIVDDFRDNENLYKNDPANKLKHWAKERTSKKEVYELLVWYVKTLGDKVHRKQGRRFVNLRMPDYAGTFYNLIYFPEDEGDGLALYKSTVIWLRSKENNEDPMRTSEIMGKKDGVIDAFVELNMTIEQVVTVLEKMREIQEDSKKSLQ